MMGTADEVVKAPEKGPIFVEDMPEQDQFINLVKCLYPLILITRPIMLIFWYYGSPCGRKMIHKLEAAKPHLIMSNILLLMIRICLRVISLAYRYRIIRVVRNSNSFSPALLTSRILQLKSFILRLFLHLLLSDLVPI